MRTELLSRVICLRAASARQVTQLPGLLIQPREKMDPASGSLIPSPEISVRHGESSIQRQDQKHFLTNPGQNLHGLSLRLETKELNLRFPVSALRFPVSVTRH